MKFLTTLAVVVLVGCGGQSSGGTGGGSAGGSGTGGGSATGGGSGTGGGPATGGGSGTGGGGSAAGGGSGTGGGGTAGGTGGGAGNDAGIVICSTLGSNCACPDAGTKCTSAAFTDDPYLWCLHDKCTSYCNAPTPAQMQALCPSLFKCTSYAFGNESPTWQCR